MKSERDIDTALDGFIRQHALPPAFRETATAFYVPLVDDLLAWRAPGTPLILGINGAQGTGKSTLAEFLQRIATLRLDWRCAVLSIDDFYLTQSERRNLASDVHPLLQTRGVPGTHDTTLLATTLRRLRALAPGESVALSRFDKSIDDRAPDAEWPIVEGPLDMVILEGWCVGSSAGDAGSLNRPMNALEQHEDADGRWRRWVEERLREDYAPLFTSLDRLVLLAAPSWDAVFRWRLEQETKLRERTAGRGSGLMSDDQITRFIQHYERITRRNLDDLPDRADVVLVLGEDHNVIART